MVDMTTPMEGDGGYKPTYNRFAPPCGFVGYPIYTSKNRDTANNMDLLHFSNTNIEQCLYKVTPAKKRTSCYSFIFVV